jgi:radical SAM superfamily enzyme YgiQ (UPF0313 family)
MKVKFILPALIEATQPEYRPIKYALFPPLGLATLAGYLRDEDEVTLEDEHVQPINLEDAPDLVAIQVYITSANRAYELADTYRARGAHVCLGGLHVTSLPQEAAVHADTLFFGPGEDTWPAFLNDFRRGEPKKLYQSTVRTLAHMPRPRRDLFQREHYLVPNSIVVSRGCPHACDFCYKDSFYQGGKSFYTQHVDAAISEINSLSGRHLYFLDDHLFGNPRFASALFDGLCGMDRVWQAAATVRSVLQPGLIEKAAAVGLRSLFIGFETLSSANLEAQKKRHNLHLDYAAVVARLHELGVMVNASFVFGLDEDDETVFQRTVEWAVKQGIETATFHILTPYPGTGLHHKMTAQGRILHSDWDRYDTRHVVFRPAHMTPAALEAGYWSAYREFYSWHSIFEAAWSKPGLGQKLRHLAYTGGWKKAEPIWDWVIRHRLLPYFLPILETVLSGSHRRSTRHQKETEPIFD